MKGPSTSLAATTGSPPPAEPDAHDAPQEVDGATSREDVHGNESGYPHTLDLSMDTCGFDVSGILEQEDAEAPLSERSWVSCLVSTVRRRGGQGTNRAISTTSSRGLEKSPTKSPSKKQAQQLVSGPERRAPGSEHWHTSGHTQPSSGSALWPRPTGSSTQTSCSSFRKAHQVLKRCADVQTMLEDFADTRDESDVQAVFIQPTIFENSWPNVRDQFSSSFSNLRLRSLNAT